MSKKKSRKPKRRNEKSNRRQATLEIKRDTSLSVEPKQAPSSLPQTDETLGDAPKLKAREITQRVGSVNQSVQGRLKSRRSSLYAWYMKRSSVERALLGLIILPILAALVLLQGVILPALVMIGGAVFAVSKILFVLIKGGAFVVYISYKVFKIILGLYLCVSRSLTGWRAHTLRAQQAQDEPTSDAQYPTLRSTGDHSVELSPSVKRLTLKLIRSREEAKKTSYVHPILFSYMRYFLIGQFMMYRSFWRDRGVCFKAWLPEGQARIKEIFREAGETIFSPHLIGPHINRRRILVPGDAKLLEVSTDEARADATYTFEVLWREHHKMSRWPFIEHEDHQQIWRVSVPLALDSLTEDQIGYRRDVTQVDEPHGSPQESSPQESSPQESSPQE